MAVLEDSESGQTTRRSLKPKATIRGRTSKEEEGHAECGDGSSANGRSTVTSEQALAYFHRSEIDIERKPAGEGYHGIVYEIKGIRLRDDSDCSLSFEEQQARRQCCHQLQRDDGRARYVMKHLNPRLLQQAGRKDVQGAAHDLVAEANFLQELNHPNILRLQGLAQGGASAYRGGSYDSFFLITERLSETLAQRIQQWRQQQKQSNLDSSALLLSLKYSYGLQIARALRYLHDQQLVFRDLKPSNIGFSADDPDKIQVFDFGLCRKLPEGGESDDVFSMSGGVGTRRYCAVEVCQHRPYNCKIDVYSWSMVFYELLTLDKPFADFSKADHEKFVCEMGGSPNLCKYKLPRCIQSLLRNAWSRNVVKRWTMAQVCEELELIIAESSSQEEPTGMSGSCSQPMDGRDVFRMERRRNKAMDRKDVMVNLEEECSSSLGFLSARA